MKGSGLAHELGAVQGLVASQALGPPAPGLRLLCLRSPPLSHPGPEWGLCCFPQCPSGPCLALPCPGDVALVFCGHICSWQGPLPSPTLQSGMAQGLLCKPAHLPVQSSKHNDILVF